MHSSLSERRRHRLFQTLNTDYHLRDDYCVGVRDRASSRWLEDHLVLGRRLHGSLEVSSEGCRLVETGSVGHCLWFDAGGLNVVTSPLVKTGRPEKTDIENYVEIGQSTQRP